MYTQASIDFCADTVEQAGSIIQNTSYKSSFVSKAPQIHSRYYDDKVMRPTRLSLSASNGGKSHKWEHEQFHYIIERYFIHWAYQQYRCNIIYIDIADKMFL